MQKKVTQRDILSEMTIHQILANMAQKLENIEEKSDSKDETIYLTRAQVAKMLSIDLSTIHNWCKKGKIRPHGIGNRVYFKMAELEEDIKPLGRK